MADRAERTRGEFYDFVEDAVATFPKQFRQSVKLRYAIQRYALEGWRSVEFAEDEEVPRMSLSALSATRQETPFYDLHVLPVPLDPDGPSILSRVGIGDNILRDEFGNRLFLRHTMFAIAAVAARRGNGLWLAEEDGRLVRAVCSADFVFGPLGIGVRRGSYVVVDGFSQVGLLRRRPKTRYHAS